MKVILDTNIFVSALFWGGKPQEVVKACLDDKYELITSTEILNEYFKVTEILVKKYTPKEDVHNLLDYIVRNSTLVDPVKSGPITADPKDDMFFEAAISSGAMLIVSGDKHLLDKDTYMGISVLTAAGFLQAEKV